jgi:hypothetical protein
VAETKYYALMKPTTPCLCKVTASSICVNSAEYLEKARARGRKKLNKFLIKSILSFGVWLVGSVNFQKRFRQLSNGCVFD